MQHDVFISYSTKNKIAAVAICHLLESSNIKCWMAPRDIPAGSDYGELIDQAIKTAKVFVVVFSQTAAESKWVKGELNIAFEEQKVIIPYRIDATPFSGQNRVILNQKHWIDAYPDYETKFSDLVDAVRSALGMPQTTSPDSPSIPADNFWKRNFKWVAATLLTLVFMCSLFCLIFHKSHHNSFSYNENGLNVAKTDSLDDEQQIVLKEILDNMIFVEGGSFEMGNDYNDPDCLTDLDSFSINPHNVTLDSYYISRYEVTQKQWKAFADILGCYKEYGEQKAIDNVSWEEATSYAKTLSQITGLNVSLPSEAQWEYAAKGAGKNHGFHFSGFEERISQYAWTISDDIRSGAEVGQRLPNEIGLYDMTGNVSEWCLDDYALYSPMSVKNPVISVGNKKKIYRGGDYRVPNMMDMKITTRYYAPSFAKREGTGLRLVINP